MSQMSKSDFGRRCRISVATCALLTGFLAHSAFAQEADDPSGDKEAKLNTVLVLGSQIQGAKVSGALPVTVVSPDDIEATGAVSAEDLFRTVPSAGDITFNKGRHIYGQSAGTGTG